MMNNMKSYKMMAGTFLMAVLLLLMLSGCGNGQPTSDQPSNSLPFVSGSTGEEESSTIEPPESNTDDTDDTGFYSDMQFLLISHAQISYDSTLQTGNDTPENYFDIASPYESYSYYEDGSPLLHEVYYVEGGQYMERWEQDENGNITMFDGRNGNNRVVYIYDEDNHLIQEWGHDMNYRPDSVIIYDDYDEHGNYGSTVSIVPWGGSIVKEGGTWYDLDSLDYNEVRSTTHHYYTYEYDEAGRLTSIVRFNHDGSDRDTYTYEYDSQGNLIYEKNFYGDIYIREYHSNGAIALFQEKLGDSLLEEIVYDSHGNPISKYVGKYNETGGIITTYENEYDKSGNLVRRFTYDEEGNCKYYDIWRYIDMQSYLDNYNDYLVGLD